MFSYIPLTFASNLKNRQKMNMSEFCSELLFHYQTDAAPRKLSNNACCISEGVEYRNFIKWYRDNKKRLCESEMEEILLSLLMVTDLSKSNLLSSEVVTSQPSVEESNVVSSRNHALWLHGTCPT